MNRSISAILLLLFATPSLALGIGMHNADVTPEQAYRDHAQLFPSVGYMYGTSGGPMDFMGSGVLIDPHWVLTAAHVIVDENSGSKYYPTFGFGLGKSLYTDPGEMAVASHIFVHPDYQHGTWGDTPDLALLYFPDPFISAAPAVRHRGTIPRWSDLHIVGYGRAGTPATGMQPADATKRAGVMLTYFGNFPQNYVQQSFEPPTSVYYHPLGATAMPGDSGGGSFTEVNGELQVAAISSYKILNFQGQHSVSYGVGGYTFSTRVAPFNNWIEATMALNVPEPSTIAAVIAAVAPVALWRRRGQLVG